VYKRQAVGIAGVDVTDGGGLRLGLVFELVFFMI
jgi:hypothetical protein